MFNYERVFDGALNLAEDRIQDIVEKEGYVSNSKILTSRYEEIYNIASEVTECICPLFVNPGREKVKFTSDLYLAIVEFCELIYRKESFENQVGHICTFYSDRPLSMGDIWGLEYNIVEY